MLAAMWILVMMAGRCPYPASIRTAAPLAAARPPGIPGGRGFAGFFAADAFPRLPRRLSQAVIIAVEFTLMLSIGLALGLLAAGPPVEGPRR